MLPGMALRETSGGCPLLSVVVPVHRVEPYLRQCLDSVLAEAGADVEVVAVDDASPDGCPAILDTYARADPRVRVVHLPANVGLGEARNAGLDRARGDYVWFVDSDDWLPPGTLPAVLAALRDQGPDVLVMDHIRVYEADGREELDGSSTLLRGVAGVAPLSQRPALLGVTHAAWNKVVRRDLLRDLGLRFFPGWYEDCAFGYPVLMAAGGIAVLDRVCYHYRQRVSGAITRTVSRRHFEVFDQYERLFDQVDRLGAAVDPFRARLFHFMVNHYLVIAGNDDRLPPDARQEFFRRIAAHYRRYQPADGHLLPGGVAGLKHRIVRADSYLAYAMLRTAYRPLVRLRDGRRAAATPAGAAGGGLSTPAPEPAGRQRRVAAIGPDVTPEPDTEWSDWMVDSGGAVIMSRVGGRGRRVGVSARYPLAAEGTLD